MSSVGVNPPKTPVTEGSGNKSLATLPNVCKMPGPPAPFVPTPLPNLGQSSDGLADCTSTVKFEGKKVAIKGSYYMSKLSGDMASKGTGGGIVSSVEEGKAKFVAPGSMNVKAEGKNIQLLGDAMTNNGSNPSNSGTIPGNFQEPQTPSAFKKAVGSANAKKLCDAACKALKKKKKSPKSTKTQKLMRDALDPKPRGQGGVLTEVGQKIAKGGGEFIGKWGPSTAGAAKFVKWDVILTKAGTVVGKKSLTMKDVQKIVEVKFPGDSKTINQKAMEDKMGKTNGKKVVVMDVDKCCSC